MTEPQTTEPPIYLDITEAADYIRQPVAALRAAVRAGHLRHIRRGPGGKLWFKHQWLRSYMDSLETSADPAAAS